MTNKIQVPGQFAEKQQALAKVKIEEAQKKLMDFLEKENLTIKPMMDYTRDGVFPSYAVVPNEFLKPKEEEKSGGEIIDKSK